MKTLSFSKSYSGNSYSGIVKTSVFFFLLLKHFGTTDSNCFRFEHWCKDFHFDKRSLPFLLFLFYLIGLVQLTKLQLFQIGAASSWSCFKLELLQVRAASSWSCFKLELIQVRAVSNWSCFKLELVQIGASSIGSWFKLELLQIGAASSFNFIFQLQHNGTSGVLTIDGNDFIETDIPINSDIILSLEQMIPVIFT